MKYILRVNQNKFPDFANVSRTGYENEDDFINDFKQKYKDLDALVFLGVNNTENQENGNLIYNVLNNKTYGKSKPEINEDWIAYLLVRNE